MRKCTGQDMREWGVDAVFEVACQSCGHPVEFFKDEITRNCPQCRTSNANPQGDFGCGQWCSSQSDHKRNHCSKFKRKKDRFYGRL